MMRVGCRASFHSSSMKSEPAMSLFSRVLARRESRSRKPSRGGRSLRSRSPYFRRSLLESLELRRVLTSNLYIDFGDAFTANTLTDTVAHLKASPVNGFDFQDID